VPQPFDPNRERASAGAVSKAASRGPAKKDRCQLGCFAEFKTIQADLPVSRWQADAAVKRRIGPVWVEDGRCRLRLDYRQMASRAAQIAIACSAPKRRRSK